MRRAVLPGHPRWRGIARLTPPPAPTQRGIARPPAPPGRRGAGRLVRYLVPCLVLAVLQGCTGEPSSQQPPKANSPAPATGPSQSLPVAGSFVHTAQSAEGQVVERIAVHSLRRTRQSTVLDWSITPISAEGHAPGSRLLVRDSDLGSLYGYQSIDLVDAEAGTVHRPLLSGAAVNADCLCRPYFSPIELTVGETSIFQIAFPPLPEGAQDIDVAFNGGSVIPGVPITPAGQVPTAKQPVELAAPEPSAAPLGQTAAFRYPQGAGVVGKPRPTPMRISIESLTAYPEGTRMVWSVTSQGAGEGLVLNGGPVADYTLHPEGTGLKSTVADGPGLLPAGADAASTPVLRSRYSTFQAKTDAPPGQAKPRWQQCRCSDWQERAGALAKSGGTLRLFTDYPALPSGTSAVSVRFPGTNVPALQDIAVTPAGTAGTATSGAPRAADVGEWHWAKGDTPRPLTPADWPTPVPDAASYPSFDTVIVDQLVTKTTTDVARSDKQRDTTTLSLDTTVLFGPDSAALRPAASAQLRRIATQLREGARDGSMVTVTGYVAGTDSGSVQVQMSLSRARANAVHNALRPLVGAKVKWAVSGKGAADPVASNDTEAGRRLNRRVTITYQG